MPPVTIIVKCRFRVGVALLIYANCAVVLITISQRAMEDCNNNNNR